MNEHIEHEDGAVNDELALMVHIAKEAMNDGDVSTDTLFDLDSDALSSLLIKSYVRYGDNDTIELTDNGYEFLEQELFAPAYEVDEDEATDWLMSSIILGEVVKRFLDDGMSMVVDVTKLVDHKLYIDDVGDDLVNAVVTNIDGSIHISPGTADMKDGDIFRS